MLRQLIFINRTEQVRLDRLLRYQVQIINLPAPQYMVHSIFWLRPAETARLCN